MKSLIEFLYKDVYIMTNENKIYIGEITYYENAEDSEEGMETIGISMGGYVEAFTADMIKTITLLKLNQNEVMQVVRLRKKNTPLVNIAESLNKSVDLIKAILQGCGYEENELVN